VQEQSLCEIGLITRIESVIVAREKILSEMLKAKKKEEAVDDVPSK